MLEQIVRLRSLLSEERAAIAQLDAEKLAALALEKQQLVAILQDDGLPRDEVGRLLADAQANAALLEDAIALISCRLSGPRTATTYDAHAHVRVPFCPILCGRSL